VEWLNGRRAPGVTTVDATIPGPVGDIPVRVYRPADWAQPSGLPVVVAFHGGGFVFGNLDTGDWLCSNVCARTPAVVVSVDYRLAPEHPAPAAHLDAYAATSWIAEHASELGGRVGQLAVLGDSSGGTLAASVALAARDNDGPDLMLQALAYPITDLTLSSPSIKRHPHEPLLRAADLRAFIDLYLGPHGDPQDPGLSPLLAHDHTGLPRALILTADHDPLVDDGRRYAQRLLDSGVAAEAVEFNDSPHGFFSFPRHCAAAAPALQTLVHSLRSARMN
jgi:acetyl esterase